jgi:hypothetical protein
MSDNLNDELVEHVGRSMRIYNSYKKLIRGMQRSLIWLAVVMIFNITMAVLVRNMAVKAVLLLFFVILVWHFNEGLTLIASMKKERANILEHIERMSKFLNH